MAKIKNKISYLLALLAPLFSINSFSQEDSNESDTPREAGTEEEAVNKLQVH